MTRITTDLCIIGADSGGLSLAAGAVQMGAWVVLIEAGEMGGDCLNTGCVPSKTLLASARLAHDQRQGGPGIAGIAPQIDYAAVIDNVSKVIASIAPADSQARFEALGVKVIRAWARFVSPQEVEAGEYRITARRFVLATGARPVIPDIPGLADMPYLTNESLFTNRVRPRHLLILGGGPVGIEMAQAHRRLGCEVTVIQRGQILPQDDADATAVLRHALQREGVRLIEGRAAVRFRHQAEEIEAVLDDGTPITASHLLIAAGRKPALAGMSLEAAGVNYTARGVTVGASLRSSNRRVFAVGDAAGGAQYTHLAGSHAGVVIRQVLFGLPARADRLAVPHVTYTDPELAQVGLTEATARAQYGTAVKVIRQEFSHNDRAIAEGRDEGFLKLVMVGNRAIGITIVGRDAGELIGPWGMIQQRQIKLADLAGHIAAYPTRAEISKRAAGAYFSPKLFDSAWVKRVVRLLQRVLP